MKITSETVRADFNDPLAVLHYTRAAHFLGLWESERILIERFFPDRGERLLEAGCGAGRVTVGLWEMGYREIVAFDFAGELLDQARSLAAERGATAIEFRQADATNLQVGAPLACRAETRRRRATPGSLQVGAPLATPGSLHVGAPLATPGSLHVGAPLATPGSEATERASQAAPLHDGFNGALFMFNGLMQIPGRENRRQALRGLSGCCQPGAPLIFSTHDRDSSPTERALWRLEAQRWSRGEQDPRLAEFGDRYFEDEAGRTFMHLPDRAEILEDLAATGWRPEFDALRREIANESQAVQDFSDECRFWVGRRIQSPARL